MKPGINKGQAVKLLQDSLEIKPEETMAFGDQLNDIEMLEQAYYSFAVGNARPEVKATARFQTDTNVNDGVLKILKASAVEDCRYSGNLTKLYWRRIRRKERMRFIHTSDLHIGKAVGGFSMLEEQDAALKQITDYVKRTAGRCRSFEW